MAPTSDLDVVGECVLSTAILEHARVRSLVLLCDVLHLEPLVGLDPQSTRVQRQHLAVFQPMGRRVVWLPRRSHLSPALQSQLPSYFHQLHLGRCLGSYLRHWIKKKNRKEGSTRRVETSNAPDRNILEIPLNRNSTTKLCVGKTNRLTYNYTSLRRFNSRRILTASATFDIVKTWGLTTVTKPSLGSRVGVAGGENEYWFSVQIYATSRSDVDFTPELRRTFVTPRLVQLA